MEVRSVQRCQTSRRVPALAVLGALSLLGAGAWADTEAAPVVPLDRLLVLPAAAPVEASIERHGGDTKAEWQARFHAARKDVTLADDELREVREELEEAASKQSSWKMSAPGLGAVDNPQDAPSNYQKSRELKQKREAATRARDALRDLEVEANLAGVPESWRKSNDNR